MTAQEVYNKVRAHLLTQGKQSVDDVGRCLYRGPDGTSCAVGCLIPDDVYDPVMENASVYSALAKPLSIGQDRAPREFALAAALRRLGLTEHGSLLTHLQAVHDSYAVQQWTAQLNRVAAEFNLEVQP